MKRILLAGLALTMIAAAGPSSAADLSLPLRRPPAIPSGMNWTGCYVGIAAGEGEAFDSGLTGTRVFNGQLPQGLVLPGFVPGGTPVVFSVGAFAGGQLGCNYQMNAIVVGIEGEGFWSGLAHDNVLGGTTSSPRNKAFYDAAVRFGFVIFDRALLYGKLGAVWSQQSYDLTAQAPGAVLIATGSWTAPGVIGGIGVDYAITNNWIARAEVDLMFAMATTTLDTTFTLGPLVFTGPSSQTMMTGKVISKLGLSYKF